MWCSRIFLTTTNDNGLISLEIGGGTIVTGTFTGIDWSTGLYFIKTETDPTGGTSYTITGTSQLLSVPYALYAKNSEKANELELKLQKLSNTLIAGVMVTDIDGNSYNTVKIGTQVWMAEQYDAVTAWHRTLEYNTAKVYRQWSASKTNGCSVRCIKD